MDQSDLMRYLLDVLEDQKLRYGIAGSHASMAFGEPRLTNDIDVVVELNPTTLAPFIAAFPPADFYVSEQGAEFAATRGGMFNIIHPDSGNKIDVIVPATKFEREQLSRIVRIPVFVGRDASFISPEDVIIKKMVYFQEGGSEKHLRDIAGILRVLGDRIDQNHVLRWSEELGLMDIWQAILAKVRPL